MDESVFRGGWYGGKPRSAFFPRRWRGRARCVKGDAVAPGPDVTVKSQSSEWCLHSGDKSLGESPRVPRGRWDAAVTNEKKVLDEGDCQLTESLGDVEPVHHPFVLDAGLRVVVWLI